jgi:hypothetical protein
MRNHRTFDELILGIEKEQQSDPRIYHNTKKLLKVYSTVVWCLEHSIIEMESECNSYGLDGLLDTLTYLASSIECELNSLHLEERTRSLLFSGSLVKIVNRALFMLKEYPHKGERYFEIINKMHILKYQYSEQEMLEFLHISRRSLYREKKEAINLLGIILWGFLIPDLLHRAAQTWH